MKELTVLLALVFVFLASGCRVDPDLDRSIISSEIMNSIEIELPGIELYLSWNNSIINISVNPYSVQDSMRVGLIERIIKIVRKIQIEYNFTFIIEIVEKNKD